ncbi:MAG: 4Fe-4S dicluster domain-containing protein [Caldilineae bacterium]|nr:MAG: 4Fe-4S dicluster domain-containing protein [Caldilineae bacterium]
MHDDQRPSSPSLKAHVRSRIYTGLAQALTPSAGSGLVLAWTEIPAGLPAFLRRQVVRLKRLAGNNGDLVPAYRRLFVGPARPRVYPYESCYRDTERRLAGPWAEQVAAWYATEGLIVPELQPDHIAAELAFMAHLTALEAQAASAGNERAAGQYRRREAAFLRQHLLAWAPEFCRQVQAADEHPFYVGVARLLATWLEWEAAHLGLSDAAAAVAYPTRVVARLCTLCGVCAEACSVQALKVTWADGEARLTLEPAGCIGCRLCAQVCPFNALRLGDTAAAGLLASSPLLPCPQCGRPALPEAFWRHMQRRLDSGPAAAAARRCAHCKASLIASAADGSARCTPAGRG